MAATLRRRTVGAEAERPRIMDTSFQCQERGCHELIQGDHKDIMMDIESHWQKHDEAKAGLPEI